jgi:AcrR family transcriptional regulator
MAVNDNSHRASRRAPKGDKRERTRAALLEAARAVVREKGHEGTTLEDVAQRAGMTTGAIYGNFKNKAELFVALGQAYWVPIAPKVKPGATLAELCRALAEATLATIPDRTAMAVGRLSGMAYALTHSDLRERIEQVTESHYAFGAEWLRSVISEDELPMPAAQMVRVVHALSEGLVLQRILTPALCPDDVFFAAFAALAHRREV